jgi:hypothetical protein
MGISVSELGKGTTFTPLQAHIRYLLMGLTILNAGVGEIAVNQQHAHVGKLESFVQNTVTKGMFYACGVRNELFV